MLQDAPGFPDVYAALLDHITDLSESRGRPILVAHNLPFDHAFLHAELTRHGLPAPDWDFACSLRDVAHLLWPGQPASLSALTERLSIPHAAHRALPDVLATCAVLAVADAELQARWPAPVPAGVSIRRLIEDAAEVRRISGQERGALYITHTGVLFHTDRACLRLERAAAILPVDKPREGLLPCSLCVSAAEQAE